MSADPTLTFSVSRDLFVKKCTSHALTFLHSQRSFWKSAAPMPRTSWHLTKTKCDQRPDHDPSSIFSGKLHLPCLQQDGRRHKVRPATRPGMLVTHFTVSVCHSPSPSLTINLLSGKLHHPCLEQDSTKPGEGLQAKAGLA